MDNSKKFLHSGFVSGDATFPDTAQHPVPDLTIGEIISKANNLSPEQIESIVKYQREHNVRFGEAAVALGLVNTDDVMWALAQQFHYPYTAEREDALSRELVVATSPFSVQAEAFRTARSHLIMKMDNGSTPRKALAVVSADTGDGRSYFAANIAAAFSQLSGRTLLIDANMRHPRQHEIFKLANVNAGLSSILMGRAVSNVIKSVKSMPSLFVLPVGTVPPNPLELAERPGFGILIRELLVKFDHVVVDTPAHSQGMDGAVIAAKCGAAVLIARQNVTRVRKLESIVGALRMSDTSIVGSIVVDH